MIGIGEHARSALWLGVGVLLFIICLSAGSTLFQTTATINAKIYTLIGTTDNNQQATFMIEQEYICTGAEVMQTIHNIDELDAAVEVNGQRFDNRIDPDELDVSSIDVQRMYRPTYVRNTNGQLVLLKYDVK
ncbi:hypothetical protein [Paenibacillus campi]|uniref:hypothetical protein n=1 Tax=Paenibacillus campi TaxID=3106031 RepID=UPI002AFFC587|nr:hypothetical protein [Paenibacillus sp. SGZ-1014]